MEEKVSTSLPQVESVTVLLPLLPVRFVLLLAPVRPLLSGSPIPLFSDHFERSSKQLSG
ncbi:hypothetical protein MtrunA17_Chr5g0426691 [Medicago truncatula]|uniref:Uncharacterized protein n=1 Tax=Medicago truncatula TaxID=3880 RepID=A0A396HS62_MEDTR|nr:hypothetical protein MtrunA17_Chr5g0426691 [Medicago truncatula]